MQARLEREGIASRPLEAYWDRTHLPDAEEAAWRCARTWHQDAVVDAALRRGTEQPAELTELYLGNYLKWALIKALELRACLASEQPERIFVLERASGANGFFPGGEEPFAGKFLAASAHTFDRLCVQEPPVRRAGLLERLKGLARDVIGSIVRVRGTVSRDTRTCVAIISAPQHVETVARALQGKARMLHLDEAFRLAKLPFVRRHGMAYASYPDLEKKFGPAVRTRVADYQAGLSALSGKVLGRIADKKLLTVSGIDLLPLALDRVKWLLEHAAAEAVLYADVLGAWLDAEKVDAVVVDEDTVTFRKTLVREARRRGIATIQVPHGVSLAGYHYDLFPVSSARVAVGGPGIADFYRSLGTPPEAIRVTGVPRYDCWSGVSGVSAGAELRKRYGIKSSDRMILFGSTALFPLNLERRLTERQAGTLDLLRAATTFPDMVVAVRLHPLDPDPEATLQAVRGSGVRFLIAEQSVSAADWMRAADVTVSFVSNLAIESIALGRPTVILDYFDQYADHVPYFAGEGAWMKARNPTQILQLLNRFLGTAAETDGLMRHAREWLLREWVGPMDGRSGERVADAVLEAAAGSRAAR